MKDGPDQTLSVHGGRREPHAHRSVTTPIFTSSTYSFPSTAALRAHLDGSSPSFHYGRYGNPTVEDVERHLAELEGAGGALFMSSGMAALSLVFLSLLRSGQHVVFTADVYRPTAELLQSLLSRFGVESDVVGSHDLAAVEAAIRPRVTRMIFTELPSNPHTRVVDLEALAAIKASHRGVRLVVDATFATPLNVRPLSLGADVVVHSLTKYLAGHNDVIAGAVLGSAGLIDALREQRALLGSGGDPFSAYSVVRGLKTFALRMDRHNRNAQAVAEYLVGHSAVERVWYPGVSEHPDHEVARRLLRGYGGVVSFVVRGGLEAGARVVDRVGLIQHSASLGGVESLIQQPAVFTWHDLDSAGRAALGIEDGLLRLSVGLEQVEDIIADLDQALST